MGTCHALESYKYITFYVVCCKCDYLISQREWLGVTHLRELTHCLLQNDPLSHLLFHPIMEYSLSIQYRLEVNYI